MPITYGNSNYRRKYEAFQIVDQSGKNPLAEAIACAQRLTDDKEKFDAWIRVCEFVYAKPKFVESTPDESLRNAETAQKTLRWMEYVADHANGETNSRSHLPGLGNRESPVQTPQTPDQNL